MFVYMGTVLVLKSRGGDGFTNLKPNKAKMTVLHRFLVYAFAPEEILQKKRKISGWNRDKPIHAREF